MLRAARLQNALTFMGTPFQIDAWVAAHGLSFALSEMTSLLENITTPNISQNVFETAEWSGSKLVEYQVRRPRAPCAPSCTPSAPPLHLLRLPCAAPVPELGRLQPLLPLPAARV